MNQSLQGTMPWMWGGGVIATACWGVPRTCATRLGGQNLARVLGCRCFDPASDHPIEVDPPRSRLRRMSTRVIQIASASQVPI